MIEYRKPTDNDVRYLLDNMRQADIDEIKAATSIPVEFVVERSVLRSTLALSFVHNGKLAAIFGYGGGTLSTTSSIWMLGTPIIDECKKSFIKEARKVVNSWVKCFPDRVFENEIHLKNVASIKLLIMLGAQFSKQVRYTNGEGFITFRIGGNQ